MSVYGLRNLCFLVDIDECQSPGACASNQTCNNTVGSYTCECPLGFVDGSGSQNPLDTVCVGEELNLILYLAHTLSV